MHAISISERDEAIDLAKRLPHVKILRDASGSFSGALEILRGGERWDGDDDLVPTMILVDRAGTITWSWRPPSMARRLGGAGVLAAIRPVLGR